MTTTKNTAGNSTGKSTWNSIGQLTGKPLLRALAALTLAASLVSLQAPAGTAATAPGENAGYVRLQHPVPTSSREVMEVFWYDCPHSYQLEAPLQAWAARQRPPVTIRHIPAAWPDQPRMMAYARLYYTLDRLGLADRLALQVFHAVRDQRVELIQEDSLRTWAEQQELDPRQLLAAWNSPEVRQEVQQAPALRERYEVHEMPSVVVGGTYRTSPFIASGGVDGTVPVVDSLVQRTTRAAH